MALFNSSEFNGILFGEGSPTSLPPGNVVTLSAVFNGSTSFEAYVGNVVLISADITGSTEITLSRLQQFKGFGDVDFTGSTTFTSEFGRIRRASATFAGITEFKSGSFLRADINGSTDFDSSLSVAYSVHADASGSTLFESSITTDFLVHADITGQTNIYANLSSTTNLSADFSGSTEFDVETIQAFNALQAEIAGSTEFTADFSRIIGLSADITGSTIMSPTLGATYLVSADISGSTIFKTVKKLGPADTFVGRTFINATLRAPESLKATGKRRRVSFVFEVDTPRTNSGIIDQHYKIFRFYNSLTSLSETLNYVRRTAQNELQSYNIDSTSHRIWNSNADLMNIRTGQRGRVARHATGIFHGRTGQFALYKGPNVDTTS